MKKLLIFIVALFVLIGNVEAATYCLRNDGTAGSKTVATDCLTVGNCMNEAVHNAQTFSANDVILVCPQDGAFDYQVTTPSSGGSGTEIRYAGQYSSTYGWPVFDEGFVIATDYNIVYGIEVRPGIAESGTKTFEGIRIANTSRSWQAAEETPVTNWTKTNKFIVGVGIGMTGGGSNVTPEIRWRDKTDSGSWTALSSSGELKYGDCTALTDEANLTTGNFGISSGKTKVEGVKCEQENSAIAGGTTTLTTEQYTELQACFDPVGADDGHEYAFALFESAVQVGSASFATVTIVGNPAPIARWRFESGNLIVDSSGNNNTLTLIGTPDTDATNYWEGLASIFPSTAEGTSIAVSSLSTGYWLTSGYKTGSMTFWMRITTDSLNRQIYEDTDSNVLIYRNTTSNKLCAKLKYSLGSTEEHCFDGDTHAAGDIWHVGITYNDSTGNWIWRVWDETTSTQHSNETDTFTNAHGNLDGLSGTLYISCSNGGKTMYGNLDHLNVFNEVLTDAQIDMLRNNTYY